MQLSFPELLLAIVLATWFIISILGQIGSVRWRFQSRLRLSWLRTHDWLGLIPQWTFFAPRPSWTDYHLLYRDAFLDGTLTPWTEVLAVQPRCWWHVVWNPRKRARKALIDTVRTLFQQLQLLGFCTDGDDSAREHEVNGLATVPPVTHTLFPYLTLLHWVSAVPRPGFSAATQFMILEIDMSNSARASIVFLSTMHAL